MNKKHNATTPPPKGDNLLPVQTQIELHVRCITAPCLRGKHAVLDFFGNYIACAMAQEREVLGVMATESKLPAEDSPRPIAPTPQLTVAPFEALKLRPFTDGYAVEARWLHAVMLRRGADDIRAREVVVRYFETWRPEVSHMVQDWLT